MECGGYRFEIKFKIFWVMLQLNTEDCEVGDCPECYPLHSSPRAASFLISLAS